MTNLEGLKGSILVSLPDSNFIASLAKVGLNPTDEYETKNAKLLDMAQIELIGSMFTMAQSVRELDYQITNASFDALKALRLILLGKWGLPDPLLLNKVKGISVW